MQGAVLYQQGGHGAAALVQPGLDDGAVGGTVGVGLQLPHLGGKDHHVQQVVNAHARLGGDGADNGLAAPLLGHQLILGELLHDPVGIGGGLIHLVDGYDDGDLSGLGAVSYTHLVQNGTLHQGDVIIAGTAVGRVRAMTNAQGQKVESAGPSVPVEIIGMSEVPGAGDDFHAVADERMARELVEQRKHENKMASGSAVGKVTLEDLFSQIQAGEMKNLNIIVKADVQGSAEAVKASLEKLSNEEVRVREMCIRDRDTTHRPDWERKLLRRQARIGRAAA